MIRLENNRTLDPGGMRSAYNNTLCDLGQNNMKIVTVDADLSRPSGLYNSFRLKFPERNINCGIQEANMAGVACGLSSAGLIPFIHTFSCFIARKCADQIFLSGCFADQNVKLIGSDPGVTAEQNGATHAGMEDMSIMMSFPNITVIDPCDPEELSFTLKQSVEEYGMHYIRYNRKPARRIYESGTDFKIGKANILKDGKDATIIASGIMVNEAIEAAEQLEKEGLKVRVVDMFTWKPIDENMIVNCAKETGAIVTAENHNVYNGLGSVVARIVATNYAVPMGMIGIQDLFGQVGKLDYQMKTYHLTSDDIANKVKETIRKKQ